MNNILCDEQDGFRKDRGCLDHIYLLQSLLSNRAMSKKDTFVCFVAHEIKKTYVAGLHLVIFLSQFYFMQMA